jgi:deazaflavin-dependent oxidoreductase (nitroreductase family)
MREAGGQRSPRLGRRMARLNRRFFNHLMVYVAHWLPGLGVVLHAGRRTGHMYRTPVLVFTAVGGYVFALTYGRESEWVMNVIASQGAQLITRGQQHRLIHPELVHDENCRPVPIAFRGVLSFMRVEDFLRAKDVS